VDNWLRTKMNTALPLFPGTATVLFLATVGAVYGVLCSGLALRLRNHT